MSETAVAEKETLTPVGHTRKTWFKCIKAILKLFVRKPEFVHLGQVPGPRSIILTNHEGARSPLTMELYSNLPVRLWGAHEMNSTFRSAYRYQTHIYYHQKKQWNLWLARLFCLIATPLTRLFYIGVNLISTYSDVRLKSTMDKSIDALRKNQTLVIFPENSSKGYFKELTQFHPGAVLLMHYCLRRGMDVPVYVAYLNRETKQYVFDTPIMASKLLEQPLSREELAEKLCNRCNELGKMQLQKKSAAGGV